jgi:hypothetical protein
MTEEQLNEIGEKLAKWSRYHRQTIKINGKSINRAGATMCVLTVKQTPDGPRKSGHLRTEIIWQPGRAVDKKNSVLRKNLRDVIQQSNCDGQVLLTCVRKLDDIEELKQITAEKLAEDLSCLGQFKFISV